MDAQIASVVRAKIEKAEQFQTMAEIAIDLESYDAACSLAVSAGINASDALIMSSGLQAPSGSDHQSAVKVLRSVAGASTGSQLSALLGVKNRAQYSSVRCSRVDALEATKRSTRLLDRSKGL